MNVFLGHSVWDYMTDTVTYVMCILFYLKEHKTLFKRERWQGKMEMYTFRRRGERKTQQYKITIPEHINNHVILIVDMWFVLRELLTSPMLMMNLLFVSCTWKSVLFGPLHCRTDIHIIIMTIQIMMLFYYTSQVLYM